MSAERLEALAREAVHCRECFSRFDVRAATIDIAQPRWVGPSYWTTSRRISILMLNPGSGESRTDSADANVRQLLVRFRNGGVTLNQVFEQQRADMPQWGHPPGRFWNFFMTKMGLELDQIAFVNVAWCSTSGNSYPRDMLNHCMGRFTGRLITMLKPDVVILSGTDASKYDDVIKKTLPKALIITTFHYAHRKGDAATHDEIVRVRQILAGAGAAAASSHSTMFAKSSIKMAQATALHGPYVRVNEAALKRKANRKDDPRWIFYEAMLNSNTYEEYYHKVGGLKVEPETYRRCPVTADMEIRYVRNQRRWIADR